MIDKNFIEQLKSKNDIVEVVSQYCQLERRGGAFWARCPLPGHMEKTPSFCVNQAGQFYYCFGCSRGGDVIKFIMEIENLTRIEAIRFLAQRAGMEVPDDKGYDEEKADEARKSKERQLKILLETARFYVNNLKKAEAAPYINYMLDRGFSQKTLRAFGIGASLDYKSLPEHLKSLGYSYDDMVKCGVVSYNEETGYIDFEAKRLIVPIIDNMGNVIAFGGRVIVKVDHGKYKNTRETGIFIKNRALYNINNLKNLRREKGSIPYIIMVEGYMDVIALSEAGFLNAVASMGTSLTVEQARMLQRYSDTVVISYDGDAAGQHATFRGLQILKDAGLDVKVLSLPDGLDPDELIKARGAETYQKLIDEALPLIDYKLKVIENTFDIKTVDGKRKYVENALRVISESDKEFEREDLLKKVSEKSRITYESLKRALDKTPAGKTVRYDIPQEEKSSALEKAERFVLYAHIFSKDYATACLEDMEFTADRREEIAEHVIDVAASNKKVVPATICEVLGEDYIDELNAIFLFGDGIAAEAAAKYYSDCVKVINERTLKSQISALQEYFSTLTDLDERKNVLVILQKKINQLNALKTEDK